MAGWAGPAMGYDTTKAEELRLASMGGVPRLWMPPETTKELIFVDDIPAVVYEHQFYANGSWKNWVTCLQGIDDPCDACLALGDNTRSYMGYFSAIDTSKWTDKRNVEHQFEMTLVPAKLKSTKKFARMRQQRLDDGATGFAGCLYRVSRDTSDDAVIGNDYSFVREADMEKLFNHALYRGKKLTELWDKAETDETQLQILMRTFKLELDKDRKPVRDENGRLPRKIVPFNYSEVLRPRTHAELKLLLQGASVRGGGNGSGSATSDDVPF